MTKLQILIGDDSIEMGQTLKTNLGKIASISEHFEEPKLISNQDLMKAIEALESRLKLSRTGNINDYPNDDAAIVDSAAVLIVDYSLFDLDASVTGERIAYLARCYSKCGFIIALNQYPPYVEEYFDLTLRGHLESYADLNIPSKSLGNPNLWSKTWDGFRPWNWPIIPQAVEKFERRVDEIRNHLDDKILEFLEFTGVRALTLPRSATEFLSREKPEETTFRNFVDSMRSGNGLRGRNEKPINDEAIARIAAARIGCWLEYEILTGEDILVDAPNLISRFPSLLGKKPDIAGLDSVASFSEPDELDIDPKIKQHRFPRQNWVSRPVWFWNDLRDNQAIEEVKNPFSTRRPEQVFCEDISKFEHKNSSREFVADLSSPYARRYVKYLPEIQYTPLVRFSL